MDRTMVKMVLAGVACAALVGAAAFFVLARRAPQGEAATGAATLEGPAFLPQARAEGRPMTCTVDLAKVAMTDGIDARTRAQISDMAVRARMRVIVDGPRTRTEALIAGLPFVTIIDEEAGVAAYSFPAEVPSGAPEGCAWLKIALDDLETLREHGAGAGQFASEDPLERAPREAFTCEEGAPEPDAFATEPSCDGLPILCSTALAQGLLDADDEEVRRLCAGNPS